MRRRDAIAAICTALAALPARAQALPRVAFLSVAFATADSTPAQLLRDRLRALGDIEGQTFNLEFRVADDPSQLDAQAAGIVASRPDLIVALNVPAVDAIRRLTRTIPIVIIFGADPVAVGYSTNWSHPSENVTGILGDVDTLSDKRVELVHELMPAASRLGIVFDPSSRLHRLTVERMQSATRARNLTLVTYPVPDVHDLADIPARAAADMARILIALPSPNIVDNHIAFIAAASAHRVATMHTFRFEALDGGLIAYGRDSVENWLRTADYIHRLLHGEKIADLPFEESAHVLLTLNLKTAKAIGLEVPLSIIARADEVIEA